MTTGTQSAFTKGLAHYEAGLYQDAAALFAAAVERDSTDADALRLHGLALIRTGQTALALPLLAQARRIRPSDPLVHLHYGVGLLKAARFARAAALFRRAAAMSPLEAAPWINLSTSILALGQSKAARAAARRALALAPEAAEAHYVLGAAERAAGNLAGARTAFMQATRLAPAFADAWLSFGLVAYQLGNIGEATGAMRRALTAMPTFAAAEANLAGFLLVQGDQDQALHRLRDVLVREPGCVPARLNLANALLLDRETDEALLVLEGTVPVGREGAHWRAHRAMAFLIKGLNVEAKAELDAIPPPYGDAELLILWRRILLAEGARDEATAVRLAARLGDVVEVEGEALLEHRIISHFDLAAFRDRRGQKDRAFDHWKAGHRLLSRAQPFSREAFTRFIDASIAAFDAARLREGPIARIASDAPLFVVGLPRSGTSLTEQILTAHAMVHGTGERAHLMQLMTRLCGAPLQPAGVRRLAALADPTLTEAAQAYLAEWRASSPDARILIDKMPGNALHLGLIAIAMPGARIIHCRRDPRDIGLSIFQLRFFGYHPYAHDLGDLGWYMGEHQRLMDHWQAVLPIPMLNVSLSDWVTSFDETLSRVLCFLGLPDDAACRTFHAQTRRVRTASAEQVRMPLNARGLGRWKGYASQLAPMLAQLDAAGLLHQR